MFLNRVTPDPFENSKSETSAMGQQADRLIVRGDTLLAKFDRFGNGARRSDFEVEINWRDIEELVAQFSAAKHPSAIELESAIKLAKALITAGWRPPEISN
jgi:hypothetical protein